MEWARDKIGTANDYDGFVGVQCVDLVKWYIHTLGHSLGSIGYAYNLYRYPVTHPNMNLQSWGWSRYTNSETTPQPGDIVVFDASNISSTGHVGIVTDVNVEEQNYTYIDYNGCGGNSYGYTCPGEQIHGSWKVPCCGGYGAYRTNPLSDFSCVIRPDWPTPEPEKPAEYPIQNVDFINSSWFGQYTGRSGGTVSVPVERYIDFTIDKCDSAGNFSGSAKVTTVEGQGYDYQWVNYFMSGKINFDTNAFQMQGTQITSYDSGGNWSLALFQGTIQVNKNGDMGISGTVDGNSGRLFSFSRTSAWARDEMTEANILGLIPGTLKNADMSKKITRAEFAAIAVQLYESLTNREAASARTSFTDIIGNANEESIEKAYYLGFTAGITDDTFAPDVHINREQMATMLCRVIKKYRYREWTLETDKKYYLDTLGAPTFEDDADISDFAKPSVYYMANVGIIKGVDKTHFAPKSVTTEQEAAGYATATREQAVALSLRVYKMLG